MPAYITSIRSISPDAAATPAADRLTAPDPTYTEVLSPGELRRLPRLVKLGLYAATRCLADAGLRQVDAIAVGTGLGSFEGFEKFETALVRQQEESAPPTPFIQSLDNAVAGHIALSLQCYGYNMTYTHRAFSFETALLDAVLLLADGDARDVLVGGLDETPATYAELLRQAGHLKAHAEPVEQARTAGVRLGEGATFLVLSAEQRPGTRAAVRAVRTLLHPDSEREIEHVLDAVLAAAQLTVADLDLVLLGHSGDAPADARLRAVEARRLAARPREYFKNHCGEYHTAAAFAVDLAVRRFHPAAGADENPPRTCLIVNQYRDANYSFILLTRD